MSEIIAKTERLLIRTTDSADFDLVLPLFYESEFGSRVKNNEKLRELLRATSWEEMTQQATLTGLVFLNSTAEFCGTVSMQKTDRDVPEIGIELLKKHQNCGIGPEAITVFGNWYCCKYHIPKIMVRIRKENTHSIHVFEKLGAEFLGESTFKLNMKDI